MLGTVEVECVNTVIVILIDDRICGCCIIKFRYGGDRECSEGPEREN